MIPDDSFFLVDTWGWRGYRDQKGKGHYVDGVAKYDQSLKETLVVERRRIRGGLRIYMEPRAYECSIEWVALAKDADPKEYAKRKASKTGTLGAARGEG